MKEFPDEILKLHNLEELDISYCSLRVIPDKIGSLIYLKKLWIDNNRLIQLPHTICNLKYLEGLNISDNPLIGLPDCLNKLTYLKTLSMFYTIKDYIPMLDSLSEKGVIVEQNCDEQDDIDFDNEEEFEEF